MSYERTMLELLNDECIFSITKRGDRFRIREEFDRSQWEDLTRAELLQLADELRALAGEEKAQ